MQLESKPTFTVILPCYNEEGAISETVEKLHATLASGQDFEIIVVDDGSRDRSAEILDQLSQRYSRLKVQKHDRNRGYGAALKTGIIHASADIIAITDADGTYPNERLPELAEHCKEYEMVVGARTAQDVTYSKLRALPKFFLIRWVSWLAGRQVPDINSGMRVFRRSAVLDYLKILPDGFSFTITITLAMLTNFRATLFVPIGYKARVGKSKIKPIRDTLRFIILILRTGTYFAPVRAFFPFVLALLLAAFVSFCYDVFVAQNLTDKTVLLFLFSMNAGMFLLLADMIDKRSGS